MSCDLGDKTSLIDDLYLRAVDPKAGIMLVMIGQKWMLPGISLQTARMSIMAR